MWPPRNEVTPDDYSGEVVTALYRRYRPETFAELIGQSQVTDPLRTALRTDRVNHAYLFSGPRGCGKTTSARILARCLNCAEGPTDTPCGTCASCVELARDGSGSLDVVEIDAASHGGVDDARDLRERAIFAPARDRYKIFIIDEAHMVTSGGFNALLKIVEEPPEHVKFIFATTEPEKVISTIRSRTHHYPFRLVPPAQMLEYVQQVSDSEKVVVQPGVLPLVVRAGGGSVRDTLSLLDQLIAGSEQAAGATNVEYERAVALLGYTHGALLDEVVDAVAASDAAAAFAAIDRVVQTGQDPRRFVEDLLERLRDLIVVSATRDGAGSVLRGVPQDDIDRMANQAAAFGSAELSRAADVVNASLTEMTGATSPRLHLELMVARLLVPASDDSERGALARVERLERRIGIDGAPAPRSATAPESPVAAETLEPTSTAELNAPAHTVTQSQLRDAWPEVLESLQKAAGRRSWAVVSTTTVAGFDGEILALGFTNENDVASFRPKPGAAVGESVSEQLRAAILDVLGVRVKFVPRVDAANAPAATAAATPDLAASAEPVEPPDPPEPTSSAAPMKEASATNESGWTVTAIPGAPAAPEPEPVPEPTSKPERAPERPASKPSTSRRRGTTAATTTSGAARYGEAVVREILGASFLEEQSLAVRRRSGHAGCARPRDGGVTCTRESFRS